MYDLGILLLTLGNVPPQPDTAIMSIDVRAGKGVQEKAQQLRDLSVQTSSQMRQSDNPDSRIVFGAEFGSDKALLSEYAEALGGITTGDSPRHRMFFWEISLQDGQWSLQQGPTDRTAPYRGRERVLRWEGGKGSLGQAASAGATIAGRGAWGKKGVAVRYTGDLPVTLYTGELFENVIAVIVPNEPALLDAVWAFCSSPEYLVSVRTIDQKVGVTANTLAKVPFDVEHWSHVAEQSGPLPEPRVG